MQLISPRVALPLLAALLVYGMPAQAAPQWKWRDANGSIQYSDRPPPAGTPESAILARPSVPTARTPARQPEPAPAAASAPAQQPVKPADTELDAKKRKAEEEKKAQQKAEEEKQARIRAENCQRAQGYLKSLQDGLRIARTNAAGEREILDDAGRAEETRRTQELIAANCR